MHSKKGNPCTATPPCTWPRIASTHTTPDRPNRKPAQHRPRVSPRYRHWCANALCALPCASPSSRAMVDAPLLPRFCHASTLAPNQARQQSTRLIFPASGASERADAWRTSPLKDWLVLVGFLTVGVRYSYLPHRIAWHQVSLGNLARWIGGLGSAPDAWRCKRSRGSVGVEIMLTARCIALVSWM